MNVTVVGGGPAGLYFALLARRLAPAWAITVLERDGPDDTFGWGIVLSARTVEMLREHDGPIHAAIAAAAERWDSVDTVHRGQRVSVRGNGFCGIERLALLRILRARCREVGVDLRFRAPVTDPAELARADLLVGADGAGSAVRQAWSHFFQPSVELRQNRYAWLGTTAGFDGLTMIFRESPAGLFIAHAYRFSPTHGTFIVECPPETWTRAGLDRMGGDEACEYLAGIFAEDLDGRPLAARGALRWQNFPLVRNRRWTHDHVALVGDAAHTAHFSIGSGTKLALEDAAALARALAAERDVPRALAAYAAARKPVVDRFQAAAYRSLTWLEGVEQYLPLEPVPFTYRLMTRSGRVGYAQLAAGDRGFAAAYDEWRRRQPAEASPIPAAFLDLSLIHI